MQRLLIALLAVWLATSAAAQSARSKLYAKVKDDRVLVAIQVTPDPGAWVYDDDADSGGVPSKVVLGGGDLVFETPVFPAPKAKDDGLGGTSKVHAGRFVVYASATSPSGTLDPKVVTARVEGLACNDSLCLPWKESLTFRAAGKDELWADMPKALLASTPAETSAPASVAPGASQDWSPRFTPDARVQGRVFVRETDGRVEAAVELAVEPTYHIYHGPTQEDIGSDIGVPTEPAIDGGDIEWDEEWAWSAPHEYVDELVGNSWVHEGHFVLRATGEVIDELDVEDVTVTVEGQVCDDKGCVLFTLELTPEEGPGPDALFAPAAVGTASDAHGGAVTDAVALDPVEPSPVASGPAKEDKGLLGFLLLAVGAGLITLLMPCTYPMIPITISFFTKQATGREREASCRLALAYGAGIVLTFVAIGAICRARSSSPSPSTGSPTWRSGCCSCSSRSCCSGSSTCSRPSS